MSIKNANQLITHMYILSALDLLISEFKVQVTKCV